MIRRVMGAIADVWLHILLAGVTVWLLGMAGLFIYSKSALEAIR